MFLKISDFIRGLKSDPFYGESEYVKKILNFELKKMNIEKTLYDTQENEQDYKQLYKYITFLNDLMYLNHIESQNSSINLNINNDEIEKNTKDKKSRLIKLSKYLYVEEDDKEEMDRNDTLLEVHLKESEDYAIESFAHLLIYIGLNIYYNEQQIQKNDILNHSLRIDINNAKIPDVNSNFNNRINAKWYGYERYCSIEFDNLKYFLLSKKYLLPSTLFKDAPKEGTEQFVNNISTGLWKKKFSIELMMNFIEKKIDKDTIKFHFYEDSGRFFIAFQNERLIIKKLEGAKIVHYVIKQYLVDKNIYETISSLEDGEDSKIYFDPDLLLKPISVEEIFVVLFRDLPDTSSKDDEFNPEEDDNNGSGLDMDNITITQNKHQQTIDYQTLSKEIRKQVKYTNDKLKNKNINLSEQQKKVLLKQKKDLESYSKNIYRENKYKNYSISDIKKITNKIYKNIEDFKFHKEVVNHMPLFSDHIDKCIKKKDRKIIYKPDTNAIYEWNLNSETD